MDQPILIRTRPVMLPKPLPPKPVDPLLKALIDIRKELRLIRQLMEGE